MSDLRLISIEPQMMSALEHGADEFASAYGGQIEDAALVLDVVSQTLAMPASPPWSGYLAADGDMVIGTCAYKGVPGPEGEVEIAYFTFRPYENRGYATRMAEALVRRAFDDPAVGRIIAHTLAQPNASTRVLLKSGFRFEDELEDPEDGPIWRWSLARRAMRPAEAPEG